METTETIHAGTPPPQLDETAAPLIVPRAEHTISRRHIDPDALKIIFRLRRLGFTAYLTGGAVRDMLLGKRPKDFDIATDARPNQIRKYFANAFIIGRRFRLAHIHFRGGKVIEVATFRKDPGLPAVAPSVAGGNAPLYAFGTAAEDARRRDITINALFYDPASASVIDYVGGLADLRQRRLRVIGDIGERFREDPVRIWRVIRYAARLGFAIDAEIGGAIRSHSDLLRGCSPARLYEEFSKDLAGADSHAVFSRHREFGLLSLLLGRIGEIYESDPVLSAQMDALLRVADQAKTMEQVPGLDELMALLFWPWAAPQLAAAGPDPFPLLKKAFLNAGMVVALPKGVRAQAIDLLSLMVRMVRALRDGAMRWSIRQRPNYQLASRLCFIVMHQRVPAAAESFESLYREIFPDRPLSGGGMRRRRGRGRRFVS